MPVFFVDNQSALALAKSSIVSKRSKHMDLRLHMIRDYVKDLCYCPTGKNLADPLTKPLTSEKYISLFKCDPGEEIVEEAHACCAYAV